MSDESTKGRAAGQFLAGEIMRDGARCFISKAMAMIFMALMIASLSWSPLRPKK